MDKETVLDNAYVTLWYYPETKIVHHQMHQLVEGEHLRELLMQGLALFQKHGACKWLSDDRKNMPPLRPEDDQWSKKNWMPYMLAAGWKYWAILFPETMEGQLDMQKKGVEENIDKGVQVCIFEDPDAALAWLESVR